MLTAEIASSTVQKPLHLNDDAERNGAWVSSTSRWSDAWWDIDNVSHGQRKFKSRVRWDIELVDGSLLTDKKHAALLGWLRCLVWSLMAQPGDGADPLAPGSMGPLSSGLARVVRWLVENSIRWPHELTQEVLARFLEDLPERIARDMSDDDDGECDDEIVSHASAYRALSIIYYIWRQRRELERAGIRPMPAKPWPEHKGANSVAGLVSDQIRGWIQPLPDEVAVPLLNAAIGFLDTPARDIFRLRECCDLAYENPSIKVVRGPSASRSPRITSRRSAAKSFRFSVLEGRTEPWHVPLTGSDRSPTANRVMFQVKRLVVDLQAACCLTLQAVTGMRSSELCGLRLGINENTGLPRDVTMRISPTGLNEEFILKSELSKQQRSPREVPWLLGSRRIGDSELPVGVRALIILNELMAPYCALLRTDSLLVSIRSRLGLPTTEKGVFPITGDRLVAIYRAFAETWVNWAELPDQSRYAIDPGDLVVWKRKLGGSLTTHMLRKTFAAYVLAVAPQLLPAVKRQFHHMNMQITEGGYWGSNSPQIEPIQSVTRQITARMLLERIQGESKFGGRMGSQIDENLNDIRALIADITPSGAWVRINRWVEENDVYASHSAHGTCMPITASRMECWKRAGLRPIGRLLPNFETREASLCAGCGSFVMHKSHIPFWRDRYIRAQISLRQSALIGVVAPIFREVKRRSDQARKLLIQVSVDPEQLETEIIAAMSNA